MELLLDTHATVSGSDVVLLSFDGGEVRSAFSWPADSSLPEGAAREFATGLGDLDGDGLADLGLVAHSAAPGLPQTLELIYGSPGGPAEGSGGDLLDLGTALLAGLSPVGDLDGDGLGDVAACSGGLPGSPQVVAHVWYGASTLLRVGVETHPVIDVDWLPEANHPPQPKVLRAGDVGGCGSSAPSAIPTPSAPSWPRSTPTDRPTPQGAHPRRRHGTTKPPEHSVRSPPAASANAALRPPPDVSDCARHQQGFMTLFDRFQGQPRRS